MPLQKLPVTGLDNENQRRRLPETINKILDHQFDDSRRQTDAEKLSGIVPVNYSFPPGHLKRYGWTGDGIKDDRPAFERAYAQFKSSGARMVVPSGTSYLSKSGANTYALKFDSDVYLVSEGRTTLRTDDDNYNHILIKDGTDVDIYIKGINFDHGSASAVAESTDHICLRIESSINTIRVEDCDLTGFLADGIYLRATVNGPGGYFKNITSSTGGAGRSLVTIAKGEKVKFIDCSAFDIGLQGFVTAPTDNTTVCRNIDFINCAVYGGGNYDASPYSTTDRAGFFISGVSGASETLQSNIRVIDCRTHDFGTSAAATVPLCLGIETREIVRPIVINFFAIGMTRGTDDPGLYSYLTTGAVYKGCTAIGCDKGIWMNNCGEYTEEANTCINNTTDRDYNGPDGATNFIKADGLVTILARGSVSFSGGSPILNSDWNLASPTDLGTGDTQFTFSNAVGSANYSVIAMYRSHSGTSGFIQSASHTTTTFRILTYSGTSLSDQPFDFVVIGVPANTTEP